MFEKSQEYGQNISKILGKTMFPSRALAGEAPGPVPAAPGEKKYIPKEALAELKSQLDERVSVIKRATAEEQALSKLGLAENERDRALGLTDEETYLKNKQGLETADLEYVAGKLREERSKTENFYARMVKVAGLTQEEKIDLRKEGNQKIVELDIKLYQTSLALQEKGATSEIETEKLKEKIIVDLDKAITEMVISNKELEMAKMEDLYERGLLSIKSYYAAVKKYDKETTDAIVKSFELRLATEKGLTKEERAQIEADILKKLNDLGKKNIDTTRQADIATRDITKSTADWGVKVSELTGSWLGYWNAQKDALEIEKQIAFQNAKDDESLRSRINMYYTLKQAEAEAYKNLDISQLAAIGTNEAVIKTDKELAEAWKNLIPNSIDVATGSFKGFFDNLMSGTMSASEAFQAFAKNFVKGIMDMLMSIAMLIIKIQIMNSLKSAFPSLFGGGGETAYSVPGLGLGEGVGYMGQRGGIVRGPPGIDNVPALLSPGELVFSVEQTEMFRRGIVPALRFASGGQVPSLSFASGGPAPNVIVGGSKAELTIANFNDPRQLEQFLATSRGRSAIVNVMSAEARIIRRVLGGR